MNRIFEKLITVSSFLENLVNEINNLEALGDLNIFLENLVNVNSLLETPETMNRLLEYGKPEESLRHLAKRE